ncbi:type II toxin-antitoxin system RelE/ParE family toxin [Nocardia sp. NPDC052566]|uniref:type II toxin-antitoxin system RelE/ParE family toxin n=1 Tax=Nocardia sp. NPDC052566 TaxID=3364330 RepID=UPI0037CCA633
MNEWEILITDEVEQFLDGIYETDRYTHKLVNQAILMLEQNGPCLGRPLVDSIVGSQIANLKELRPGSAGNSEIRILFAFDPWRSAILLVAGDKAGRWQQWYSEAIPHAEQLYQAYLLEREQESQP